MMVLILLPASNQMVFVIRLLFFLDQHLMHSLRPINPVGPSATPNPLKPFDKSFLPVLVPTAPAANPAPAVVLSWKTIRSFCSPISCKCKNVRRDS